MPESLGRIHRLSPPARHFTARLQSRLTWLWETDPHWDLLYLGRWALDGADRPVTEGIVRPGFSYCTFDYLLSAPGLRKVLSCGFERALIPVDSILAYEDDLRAHTDLYPGRVSNSERTGSRGRSPARNMEAHGAAAARGINGNGPRPAGMGERGEASASQTAGVFILQAARMAGTNTATIRMWEKHGLVKPDRTSSGYRLYTMEDVSRLRELKRLSQDGVNPAGMLRILNEAPLASKAPQVPHGGGRPGGSMSERLRDLRRQKGMTLREVAAATGLSASFVSLVERGLATPSLPSLQSLATAFSTSVQGLMTDVAAEPEQVLVRAGERPTFENGEGVTIEDLSTGPSNLESLLFTVQPGAGSNGAFAHAGEEFLYMVSGALFLTLDGSLDFDLAAGDAMSYDSMRPHEWVNRGAEPAVIVWVNTPRTF